MGGTTRFTAVRTKAEGIFVGLDGGGEALDQMGLFSGGHFSRAGSDCDRDLTNLIRVIKISNKINKGRSEADMY